jgi:hypothetical protein
VDMLIEVGITAVLSILRTRKDIRKFESAIAKVFVKIENVSKLDPGLAAAIERQREKESAK